MTNKHWFKSRHWTCWHPISWQGWFVTALYVALVIFLFLKIDVSSNSVSDTLLRMAIPFVIVSALFVIICKVKTKR